MQATTTAMPKQRFHNAAIALWTFHAERFNWRAVRGTRAYRHLVQTLKMASLKRTRDSEIDEDAAARSRIFADCVQGDQATTGAGSAVAVTKSDYQAAIDQLCSTRSRSLLLFRVASDKVMPVVLFRSCSWDSRQGLHEQLNSRLREVWMHTPRNPLSYGWSGCS